METKAQICERLKEIADEIELYAMEDALTAEQKTAYDDLCDESETLQANLKEIEAAEKAQAEMAEKAKALRAQATESHRKTTPSQPGRIGNPRPAVADDPQRGFTSLADFAVAVAEARNPRTDERLMKVAAGTGLQQSISQDGGVLVPPAYSKRIWEGVQQRSQSLLSMCDQIPIDMGVESLTVPAINETSRADGSRWGGVRGYWKAELSQMTSSAAKLRDVKLTPQELYVFSYISDKLLRNAPQAASRLMETGAADEIAFKVGDSIINGDGNGKPLGILNSACIISVAKETGQAATTLVAKNFSKMRLRMHPAYWGGAVWLVNPDVRAEMDDLQFSTGTSGTLVYLPEGGLSGNPYSTLFGRPVMPIEYCATLGTTGDVILANLSGYAAAVKGVVDSAYSMHLKFDYAQTAYRIIFEVDGQPWLQSAITPYKGSTTTSTFVKLDTRS